MGKGAQRQRWDAKEAQQREDTGLRLDNTWKMKGIQWDGKWRGRALLPHVGPTSKKWQTDPPHPRVLRGVCPQEGPFCPPRPSTPLATHCGLNVHTLFPSQDLYLALATSGSCRINRGLQPAALPFLRLPRCHIPPMFCLQTLRADNHLSPRLLPLQGERSAWPGGRPLLTLPSCAELRASFSSSIRKAIPPSRDTCAWPEARARSCITWNTSPKQQLAPKPVGKWF